MFKTASLSKELLRIIRDKGTEYPFTGEYEELNKPGTYLCRQCGLALFRAKHKFNAYCGWPSFDQEVQGAIRLQTDADGERTEILCKRCDAHLGHVFKGEGFTLLNTRHCVNSASLDYVADENITDTEEIIIAGGCFWGVEYYFKKLPGVLKAESGYSGGHKHHPTYEEICNGATGHFESVRVIFDPKILTLENAFKYFFEIHDPTQTNGQGPDLGQQYFSVAFYYNDIQRKIIVDLINSLEEKGLKIVTRVLPVQIFWKAEGYHQDYYEKTGKHPYCHKYTKRF